MYGVDLRPLESWDYVLESRRRNERLCPVNAVCCQVEVSAMGRSPVQRSLTECVCVIECDQVQQYPSIPTRTMST